MANEVLIQDVAGSTLVQQRFFVTGSFSPVDPATNWTIGTPNDIALTLASLGVGQGRQSLKIALPDPRARMYFLMGCVDFTGETAQVSGETIDYYWAPSTNATQANGNVAGNSGADAAAADGALGSITLDEFLKLCIRIGPLVIHDGGVVQNAPIGMFSPPTRWGQLIVVNNTSDIFEGDDVEMHQVMNPIVDEIQ